jgi:[CysO sulfur-carrier protein]-S-L-cysteine hydrolase
MLRIRKSALDAIIAHAERELPIEACGYLAGVNGEITAYYEMTNVDASAEHFSFAVKEQFGVLRDVRQKGLNLLAVYHSHPQTPARPSAEDIKLANDPDISYIIISLAGDCSNVKSYRIIDGTAENETLEVRDDAEI